MKMKTKIGTLSVCVAMALSVTACGGGSSKENPIKGGGETTTPAPTPDEKVFVAERGYTLDTLAYASNISIIDYMMPSVQGKQVKTSAFVAFPEQKAPEGGYKVIVWQHGTLGVADQCAPTNNKMHPNYSKILSALLKEGYVIVAPDYEGLGGEGMHPYLHLSSQAISSVNAVKAAQEHYSNLSKQWMSVGQSQGGQASLGTAEYIETNGKDPNYMGAVAGAPATQLKEIILNIAPPMLEAAEKQELAQHAPISYRQQSGTIAALGTLLAYNALYAAGVKASDPSFDYSTVFTNQSTYDIVRMAEGTTGDNGICLGNGYTDENGKDIGLSQLFAKDVAKFLTENPDKGILDYPRNDRAGFEANVTLNKELEKGNLKGMKLSVPIMIIQGTADTSVPFPVTQALVEQYLASDTKVNFLPSVGSAHSEAIVKETDSLVRFVKEKMPSNVETNIR